MPATSSVSNQLLQYFPTDILAFWNTSDNSKSLNAIAGKWNGCKSFTITSHFLPKFFHDAPRKKYFAIGKCLEKEKKNWSADEILFPCRCDIQCYQRQNEYLFIVKRFSALPTHENIRTHSKICELSDMEEDFDEQFYFYRSIKWYAHTHTNTICLSLHYCCALLLAHFCAHGDLTINLLSRPWLKLFSHFMSQPKFFWVKLCIVASLM